MAETADQIRAGIEEARAGLDAKLDMLEARARNELSLRTQFSRRPWQALGAAAGAGILLGLLFGGRHKMRDHGGVDVEYDPDYDEEFVDE
ncbi:MAG: hypothetical protein ACM3NQ_10195 [Bacteroidales bacterium]